ncbi:MAG: hypothetical protein KDD34_05330, partial [Bdellovibrionales bacterium]|nr:hypothetical protein [Bdellovibrionales bacterium]
SKEADIYSLGKILDFLTDIYLEEKDLVQAITQMTDIEPQKRRAPSWSHHSNAKEELARRVQSALEKRKKEAVKTQEFIVRSVSYPYKQQLHNVDVQRLKSKKILNLLWGFGFIVIIFIGGWLYQLMKINIESESAALVIRSHRWYRVWINDKDYGFTPLDIKNLPVESIRIRWQSSSESGMRSLTLRPGMNRVNGDEFFRSE